MPDVITIAFPAWIAWLLLFCCVLNLVNSGLQFYLSRLQKKLNELKATQ